MVLKRVKRENVVAGQERKEKSRPEKKRSSFFFKKSPAVVVRSPRTRRAEAFVRARGRGRRGRGLGCDGTVGREAHPRRPRGAATSRRRRSVSVTTTNPVRTWLRNILLTSCLVTMPTARSDAGSTTTTHPIFSFTRDVTTLDSLSSGMAVTHFAAGIMKLATDGMFSLRASGGALRRPCGSRGLQCRARSPRVETRLSRSPGASSDDRRDRRRSATRLSARPVRAFRPQRRQRK